MFKTHSFYGRRTRFSWGRGAMCMCTSVCELENYIWHENKSDILNKVLKHVRHVLNRDIWADKPDNMVLHWRVKKEPSTKSDVGLLKYIANK